MKNKIRLISSLLIVCLLITGCNGTITRDIRRDGYTVQSNKFTCSFFINKSKEENTTEKVKFLTANYIISETGNIYEINISGLYSNDMNCRKPGMSAYSNTPIINVPVVAILDQSIVKGSDGWFYYLDTNDAAARYTRVTSADKEYSLYKLLLAEADVVKVVTVNSNINSYWVLKKDGAIYNYILKKEDNTDKYVLTNKDAQPVISRNLYGSIIDFNYEGDSLGTYYRTQDKIITRKITNSKKCNKYVDIPCNYAEKSDAVLNEYKDRIIAFNGNTIITDYGRVFTAGS
ncbi:MAG: hypothetical protein IJL76_02230 [Bacilli bacterium]|nr:hypothetical protein [Bacilli bacterium]